MIAPGQLESSRQLNSLPQLNALKHELIDESSSPLFRIMSVYNDADPQRRRFDGNINAFHIGGGYILSVAHYVYSRFPLVQSVTDAFFQSEIVPKFPKPEVNKLLQSFPLDSSTKTRLVSFSDPTGAQKLAKKFADYKCDTTVRTLYAHGVCKPFLIINSRQNTVFNDPKITAQIDKHHILHEPVINRHTFLLELQLVKTFLPQDIALYRIVNVPSDVIRALPSIPLDYSLYDDDCTDTYCLQNSPSGTNLGRLLNHAVIEGILDQHSIMGDNITGQTHFSEGLRYLIRGYFRFGSSGAPYVKFNRSENAFAVFALQSEACPIQLTIGNNMEGNNQWINAIANPMAPIRGEIEKLS
jgi:hypothetical protein